MSPSLSASSDETFRIYYEEVQGIDVTFPDGEITDPDGEIRIVTFSDIYDMSKTDIVFFERDINGETDRSSSITPRHEFDAEGNTMVHYFKGISTDIQMYFIDPVPLIPGDVFHTEDLPPITIKDKAAPLFGIITIFAVFLFVFLMVTAKRTETYHAGDGQ